jgi:DNA-binding NtrC family response regulator
MKILIVEDNRSDAELVLWHLRRKIPEVRANVCHSLEELKSCIVYDTEIVISDYDLLTATAKDVKDYLSSIGLNVPFIVISGKKQKIEIDGAVFHSKFELEELPAVVQRLYYFSQMNRVVVTLKSQNQCKESNGFSREF